jgi:RNA polymerase sigma-70 factor (ECF subfamily)
MDIEGAAPARGWSFRATREADWDAVYREQLPRVYNYLRFRVGDATVAEDLASATFERAWAARHRYRRDLASFGTWLVAIARNLAIDHLRARRPVAPLEAADAVAGGPDPAELAGRRDEHERLGRLLERLPERERELVALKYGAGWTNRAIGQAVKLSESNVGTILHRTIQALRADWEGAS